MVDYNDNEPIDQELVWQEELNREDRESQVEDDFRTDSLQDEKDEKEMEQELAREQREDGKGLAIKQRLKQLSEAKKGVDKVKDAQQTINRLKNIYRLINGTSAITLVGIIITFLVMNAQLIFGNLFKVRYVPPLSLVEILILGLVWLVVIVAVLLLLILIYFIVHPCDVARVIGTWWAELLGKMCEVVT